MAAERLADDLWLLPGRPRYAVNVYVIGDVLVDAATRHSAARIMRDMRGLPVRAHALTHAHMDHMGASHEICDKLGIPFMCGRGDVVTAESGGRDTLASAPLPLRLEHRAIAGPGHPVSRVLDEGDQLGGFSVLEVPGHASGHLAFWRARDRTLVLGDVLFNLPTLRLPPRLFTPDPATNLASARRLAALKPELACFGHGPPLRDPGRLRRFADGASA